MEIELTSVRTTAFLDRKIVDCNRTYEKEVKLKEVFDCFLLLLFFPFFMKLRLKPICKIVKVKVIHRGKQRIPTCYLLFWSVLANKISMSG